MTSEQNDSEHPMLISYRELRRAVGAIGIALPIALVVGENLFGVSGIRRSISDYYHSTVVGDVLVGSLCAIGVFMLSYRGEGRDNIAGNIACFAAVGVALFPTSHGETTTLIGSIHYISAAVLFLTLAYFCLISFPRSDQNLPVLPKKPLRNKIYKGCGIAILTCIFLIFLVWLIQRFSETPVLNSLQPVFFLETIAVWAFGWSWYIKGKGLEIIQG